MSDIIAAARKNKWLIAGVSFVLGAVLVLGIRAATYAAPAGTHYHANFAVYINGQRETFNGLNYYEEEAATSCSVAAASETENTPMSRVHMHGNINNVVHIEDRRVTWGNFFTAIGWNVGATYVASRDMVYQNNDQGRVSYILNGKQVKDIANTIIGDQDKLLVNYGAQTTTQIGQEYGQIKNNALKSDQSKDPASCGSHESAVTFSDRMHHMF